MTRFKPMTLLAFGLVAAGEVFAQEIRWFDNYAAAMEEATRTNKPLWVSFRCIP